MKRAYLSAYGALLDWNVTWWHGDHYTAAFLTAMGLGGAVLLNGVLVLGIFVFVTAPFGDGAGLEKAAITAVVGGWLLLNYLRLVKSRRYESIYRAFLSRAEGEQRRVKRIAWLYLVTSYLSPVVFSAWVAWTTGEL